MKFLPTDVISFIWGAVSAALILITSGFFREAGKDLWLWIKPKKPDDVLVDMAFKGELYDSENCVWVREESLSRYEETHFYYPHPKNSGRCNRKESGISHYLMVKNGSPAHKT
jgi:hypothetical protein